MSTRLKLVGVEVASFGDALGSPDGADLPIAYENPLEGVYKRINVAADGSRLTGGILVGETSEYGLLQQLSTGALPCPANPADLILGRRAGAELAKSCASRSSISRR